MLLRQGEGYRYASTSQLPLVNILTGILQNSQAPGNADQGLRLAPVGLAPVNEQPVEEPLRANLNVFEEQVSNAPAYAQANSVPQGPPSGGGPPPMAANPMAYVPLVAPQNLVAPVNPGQVAESSGGSTQRRNFVKDFQLFGLSRFRGTRNAELSNEWLRKADSVVKGMGIPDPLSVLAATTYLDGEAAAWWEALKSREGTDREISWEEFKVRFRDQYLTREVLRAKEREFYDLSQGNSSVDKYEELFQQLQKYGTKYIRTERDRIDRFVDGLNDDLIPFVEGLRIGGASFTTIYETARASEKALKNAAKAARMPPPPPRPREGAPRPAKGVPAPSGASGYSGKKRNFPSMSQGNTQVSKKAMDYQFCPKCKENHPGDCMGRRNKHCYICFKDHQWRECPRLPIKCFNCEEIGHYKSECPKGKKQKPDTPARSQAASSAPRRNDNEQGRPTTSRSQGGAGREVGHVYHMEPAGALQATNAITGTARDAGGKNAC